VGGDWNDDGSLVEEFPGKMIFEVLMDLAVLPLMAGWGAPVLGRGEQVKLRLEVQWLSIVNPSGTIYGNVN
jgi:hypothetical protein